MRRRTAVAAAIAAFAVAGAVAAQQHPAMPQGMSHEEHMAQMKKQGDLAMGFDQDKATHHFRLNADGGTIQVTANDPKDAVTLDAIQAHLQEIAASFAKGDFEKPLMTHGEEPPGVPVMRRLQAQIRYTYEALPLGGIVHIRTANAEAIGAIHEFLRYQIREHATGDPVS
jgi:hypothetical protein